MFDGKSFSGPCIYILRTIMEYLHLCYKIVPSGFYGNKYPNGTWDGLMAQLVNNEIEAGVCPFAITHQRYQVVDAAISTITTDYSIVYPRPIVKPNYAGFVNPFVPQTWASVGMVTVCLILMSWFLNVKIISAM
ncbi:UNVERIFIED_CONTAM: hypothetical protein RMT77_001701 [Armadillidium vulgare]